VTQQKTYAIVGSPGVGSNGGCGAGGGCGNIGARFYCLKADAEHHLTFHLRNIR